MAVKMKRMDDDSFNDVNVTSLIDVLFVLLIVFMVSASAIVKSSVPINLPQVHEPDNALKAEIEVLVAKDGSIFVGNQNIKNLNKLENYLRALALDKNTNKVIIRADGEANYGKVMNVMNKARIAGLDSLSLAVEQKLTK